ncbi:MAG: radical SAM protein [Cyanobacteria bacterium P01_A01_bin.37]
MNHTSSFFESLYGPVQSWRFGRSLGVDLIGMCSTCSFSCVYCQLGDIQQKTTQRQVFVSTDQIRYELDEIDLLAPVDVVTLSGSGEPTLALNLDEIIACVKERVDYPVVVLTNGSLLDKVAVRAALQSADQVVIKLDAVSEHDLQRINRPVSGISFRSILAGIKTFSEEYAGHLAIQTMLLKPWPLNTQAHYLRNIQSLMPDEVQLNVPSRPRVLMRRLEARGNQRVGLEPYAYRQLNCVSTETLRDFAEEVETYTGIPTRYPLLKDSTQR